MGAVKGRPRTRCRNCPSRPLYVPARAIQPLHGIQSRTALYRIFYTWLAPFLSVARRLFPNAIVTTEQFGQAMLNVARRGWPTPVLEQRDIARAAT